jgi:hypothetical protein
MATQSKKTVGEVNGMWALLFKMVLVFTPIFFAAAIPWAVFVTQGQILDNQFREAGARYTPEDAQKDALILRGQLTKDIDQHYHEIDNRLAAIESTLQASAGAGIKPADVYRLVQQVTKQLEELEKRISAKDD